MLTIPVELSWRELDALHDLVSRRAERLDRLGHKPKEGSDEHKLMLFLFALRHKLLLASHAARDAIEAK